VAGRKPTIRAKGRLAHHPSGMMSGQMRRRTTSPAAGSIAGLIAAFGRIVVMRSRVVKTAYLHDLHAEGL
jgi:hypothetical protein